MAAYRRLSKPPIHEAVIDVQVVPTEGFATESLRGLVEGFRPSFPTVDELQQATLHINFGGSAPTVQKSAPEGFILKTSDQGSVIQLKTTSCACSFVGHYEGWEALEEFFASTFEKFIAFSKPLSVARIGVRFINLIPVPPLKILRIQDYLPFAPDLPPECPQTVNAFNGYQDVTDSARRARCVIRQGMMAVDQKSVRTSAFLLDIDAFMSDILGEPTSEKVRGALGILRELKNSLFFGMVSEKALEPYL